MIIERHVRIIKYWIKLNSNESVKIILRTVYRSMVESLSKGSVNRLSKVKYLLESNGFADVWIYPTSMKANHFIPVLRHGLMDTYITKLREGMGACSSLSLYRNLKADYRPAPYLYRVLNRKYRNAITNPYIVH